MSEEVYKWGGIAPGLLRNLYLEMEENMKKYFLWKERCNSGEIESMRIEQRVAGRHEMLANSTALGTGLSKDHCALLRQGCPVDVTL